MWQKYSLDLWSVFPLYEFIADYCRFFGNNLFYYFIYIIFSKSVGWGISMASIVLANTILISLKSSLVSSLTNSEGINMHIYWIFYSVFYKLSIDRGTQTLDITHPSEFTLGINLKYMFSIFVFPMP